MLLCLSVLVYIPVLRSGFFIFDDFGIVAALKKVSTDESLASLWTTKGRYWRPVVMFSFLTDVAWLGANSTLMHLHNVLIHAVNSLFVFFLVKSFSSNSHKSTNIALLTAAVFALHPVNTEAVAWIAGRTDLYATLFSLAGLLLYSRSININSTPSAWGASLLFLLGSCSKEVGVPLFLAAAICSALTTVAKKPVFTQRTSFIRKAHTIAPYVVIGLGYFMLRKSAFQSPDESLAKVASLPAQSGPSIIDQCLTGITALGFYFKKFLIPAPLTFAIDSVSQLYLGVGVIVLIALFALLVQRGKGTVLLLAAFFTIGPALLNAIFHIAWTPYAERYLYLPVAVLCTYFGASLADSRLPSKVQKALLFSVVGIFLTITLQRNVQWMDSTAILADAVKKSPDNTSLRINYAIVLEEKDPETAREQLLYARKLAPERHVISKVLASIALNTMHNPNQARRDLDIYFQGEQKPTKEIVDVMIAANRARLANEKDAAMTASIKHELVASHLLLYDLTNSPSALFSTIPFLYEAADISVVKEMLVEIVNNNSNKTDKQDAAEHLSRLSSRQN